MMCKQKKKKKSTCIQGTLDRLLEETSDEDNKMIIYVGLGNSPEHKTSKG